MASALSKIGGDFEHAAPGSPSFSGTNPELRGSSRPQSAPPSQSLPSTTPTQNVKVPSTTGKASRIPSRTVIRRPSARRASALSGSGWGRRTYPRRQHGSVQIIRRARRMARFRVIRGPDGELYIIGFPWAPRFRYYYVEGPEGTLPFQELEHTPLHEQRFLDSRLYPLVYQRVI